MFDVDEAYARISLQDQERGTDFDLVTTPQGWVATQCSAEQVGVATKHHAERFKPDDSSHIDSAIDSPDARWSWYLGEWVVHQMLQHKGIQHHWLSNEDDYAPDFSINEMFVDVKVKNRGCRPVMADDWYATVRLDQFLTAPRHNIKAYIFCDYCYKSQHLTVLGKMSYTQFAKGSTYRPEGTYVHKKHTTQEDCRDIELTKIIVPMKWVQA